MKVSVIIPTINDTYLVKTIDWVWRKANTKPEFIIVNDGGKVASLANLSYVENLSLMHNIKQLGRRVSINNAAKIAKGDYLFILDAHCSMTKDWDVKLAESAGDKNIAYSVIRDMHPATWEYRSGDYLHVRINKEYTEKWWNVKPLEDCETEEESIAFTGCAWMIKKDRFWQLGGYDESLGPYGWDGPEWALRTWFNEGKVILRTDVVCGHIFGTNDSNKLYPCNMIPRSEYVKYMKDKYENKMQGLIDRFAPVPDWTELVEVKRKGDNVGPQIQRKVKINRVDEHVTKNDKGEIIKKVVEYFEYIYTDNGNGPTEEEIKVKYGPKVKKVNEEVWELKNGQLQKVA